MDILITNEDGSVDFQKSGRYFMLDSRSDGSEPDPTAGYLRAEADMEGNTNVYNFTGSQISELTGESGAGRYTVYGLQGALPEFGFKLYLSPIESDYTHKVTNKFVGIEITKSDFLEPNYNNAQEAVAAIHEFIEETVANDGFELTKESDVVSGSLPTIPITRIHYEYQHGGGSIQSDGFGYSISSRANTDATWVPTRSSACNEDSVMPVKCIANCDLLGATSSGTEATVDFTEHGAAYWVFRVEIPVSSDQFLDIGDGTDKPQIQTTSATATTTTNSQVTKENIRDTLELPDFDEWDYWMQARYPFFDEYLYFEDSSVKPGWNIQGTVAPTNLFSRTCISYKVGKMSKAEWGAASLVGKKITTITDSTTDPPTITEGEQALGVYGLDPDTFFADSSGADTYPKQVGGSPWTNIGHTIYPGFGFIWFMSGEELWRMSKDNPYYYINPTGILRIFELEGTDKSYEYGISYSHKDNGLKVEYFTNSSWNDGVNDFGEQLYGPYNLETGTGWYYDIGSSSNKIFASKPLDAKDIEGTEIEFEKLISASEKEVWTANIFPELQTTSVSAVPCYHRYPLVINGLFYLADSTSSPENMHGTFTGNRSEFRPRWNTSSTKFSWNWASAEFYKNNTRSVVLEHGDDDINPNPFANYTASSMLAADYSINPANHGDHTKLLMQGLVSSSLIVAVQRRTAAIKSETGDLETETTPERMTIIVPPPGAVEGFTTDSIISDPAGAPAITTVQIISDPSGAIPLQLGQIISDPPLAVILNNIEPSDIISDPTGEITDLDAYYYDPDAILSGVEVPGQVTDLEAQYYELRDIGCVVARVNIINERRTWCGRTKPSKYKGFVYDERISGLAGPFVDGNITAITTIENSGEVIAVDENKKLKRTNLLEFNNPTFEATPSLEDVYGVGLGESMDVLGETDEGVVISKKGEGFSYRGLYLYRPFEEPTLGFGCVRDPLFFRNSYLSVIESNWIHLGDEHNEKQVHRIDLSFHKNSFGAVSGYVCNEEGLYKGQYKGGIQEHMKIFSNLRGRRFKVKLFVVTSKKYPWALREMALGHLYGKSF